jgi:cold shock CspA family protein/ribosome-associated translation inhibitor RaiA
MQGPVEVTFKGVSKTAEIEKLLDSKIAKLDKISSNLISCRITVEQRQKHQDRGNPYRVRIDMKVPPAHELVAKQSSSKGDMHDPLETVIRKVFAAAERQLKDLARRQHGNVKTHPNQQVMGIVHKLFPDKGYGFIKTVDTQDDVYFHRNSVLHDKFSNLLVGFGVRFLAEIGEKGLQASSVEVVYKPKTENLYSGAMQD